MGKPANKVSGHDLVMKAKSKQPSLAIPMFQSIVEAAKTSGLAESQLDSAFKLNIAGFQKGSSGEIYFTDECLEKVKEWADQEKPLTAGIINKLSDQITNFTDNFGVWIEDLVITKVNNLSTEIDNSFANSETNQKNILRYVATVESSVLGTVNRMEKSLEEFIKSTNSRLNTIDTSLKVLDKETKDSQSLLADSIKILKEVVEYHEDLITKPQAETEDTVSPVEVADIAEEVSTNYGDTTYPAVIDKSTIEKAFKDYQDGVRNGLINDSKCRALLNNGTEMIEAIRGFWNKNKKPMSLTDLSRSTHYLTRNERLAAMGYLQTTGQMVFENEETGSRPKTSIWPSDALPN